MVTQHQFLRIGIEVNLLMHPVRDRVAAQVVLEQRQRHNQRHKPLPIVLEEAQPKQGDFFVSVPISLG
jgi:hypothetical protein